MTVWLWTLGSVVAVSLTSFVGLVFLGRGPERLDTLLMYLVSLAAGVLLGGAFFHLIPEAYEAHGPGIAVPSLVLVGFLGFFFLERFLWAHHHGHGDAPLTGRVFEEPGASGAPDDDASHAASREGPSASDDGEAGVRPVVVMSLLGDGLHNLIDGMIIAAAYMTGGVGLGVIASGAVLLHEVPQEAGEFGVLVRGGLSVRRALLFNFLSASMAVVGALVALLVGSEFDAFTSALLPLTAGNFVYIAAADLVPELHHHHEAGESVGHATILVLGVLAMLGLTFLRHGAGG